MANATATTKTRASRKPAAAETETVATETEFQVFTELPKRQYAMTKPAAHADFFAKVVALNEGKSGDERVWLAHPKPSKGVASAVKKSIYRAARETGKSFDAANRTIDGNLVVLVTVADQA